MKVLLINDFFYPFEVGGAETSLYALARLLSREGIEVEVLSTAPAPAAMSHDLTPFRVHFVPQSQYHNPLLDLWEFRYFSPVRMAIRLAKLLSRTRYDVIHANNELSSIAVLMARRSGVSLPPAVLTIRSYCHVCPLGHAKYMDENRTLHCGFIRTALCVWEAGPPSLRKAVGLVPFVVSSLALHNLAREAIRCFDRYICISSFVRRVMKTNLRIDPNCIKVIPETINIEHLGASESGQARIPPTPTLLYVGRLAREKGLFTLVDAFEIVAQQTPDARLVVVGDGGLRPELERLVENRGLRDRVVFAGHVRHDNIATFFAKADIVLVPSTWPEPLGIVILEALYLRKVVIATSHGGITDIIKNGVNGLLVPPGNPIALAEAILLVLGNPDLADRLRNSGPPTVLNEFSPEALLRKTLDVYRDVSDSRNDGLSSLRQP